MEILTKLGFFPLHVRKEIDAHLADRFLEAVWREALWLIKDDIATTSEIDNAIRYGFGIRWAQMGLFETYRIAGGKAGMKHFLSQFGPCLQWPWTKLMDVPELTDDLVEKIASQSDSQSGDKSIHELERIRDKNLIAILRSLKQQNFAAGNLIVNHEKMISEEKTLKNKIIVSVDRVIPVDWTDYNGHMNEGRYGQVFSDAADGFLYSVGVDSDYIASGNSYFTVENHIKYLNETLAGEHVYVDTSALLVDGKKLKLFHKMKRKKDKASLATCEQFLLHVNLNTRKSSEPVGEVASKLQEIFK
jgi:carnitine 3-dehydrogenase